MAIKIKNLFECTRKSTYECPFCDCITYNLSTNKFKICPKLKLKKEYVVFKS